MLQSFCGMRLNTAGMVIGWIGATLSLIAVILFGVCLGRLDDLVKAIMDHTKDASMDEENLRRGLIIIFSVYLTINLINMIASALLIAGTVKERHLLLVPWLINSGVSLFFSVVYMIFFVFATISSSAAFGSVALSLITAGISLAIQYLIWYAIYSLFKQLQASREQQQQLLPPNHGATSYPQYTKI